MPSVVSTVLSSPIRSALLRTPFGDFSVASIAALTPADVSGLGIDFLTNSFIVKRAT